MALRTAKVACASVKVIVDTIRSPVMFTAVSVHEKQCCLLSNTRRFLSIQPPRKPAGAFLKFMTDRSQEIISKNADANHLERCKIAGQLWRNLDPKEKSRWKLGAKEELQVYRQKYLSFLNELSNQEKAQLLQEKKEKRIMRAFRRHKMELQRFGRPKKPPNSFNLFVKASRLHKSHAEPPEFLKSLVKCWKQMPEEEKDVYRVKAKLAKEKYQQEMTKWEQKMKELGREDLIRKKSQQTLLRTSTNTRTKTVTGIKTRLSQSKTVAKKAPANIQSKVDRTADSEE